MSMMSLASPQIGYSAHLTHCTSIHWLTVHIMAAGLRSLWYTCTQTSPVNSVVCSVATRQHGSSIPRGKGIWEAVEHISSCL